MERVTEKECGSSTSSSKSSKPIPDSVMEAVKRTSKNIDDLSSNVDELLSLYGADAFPEMGPLQQAQSLILLAKATTTLFALSLGLEVGMGIGKSRNSIPRTRQCASSRDGKLGK
ncbi:hypothetical protein CQW23_33485 [Capsicum baccatum]|uniref:Nuclear nucleic acid-binding protein C1D n=1 Tax=Capsicum baccatum TaxID=33114 RepID=A0A2G2V1N0_CAPBA|nr:hypothetical protein CQW23_33485 [Capsicum baccatum]